MELAAGPVPSSLETHEVDFVEVVEGDGLPAQTTLATDEELQRLQEFLDSNDNESILEQATF